MSLDADALETEAREQTGLSAFGDGSHREGLERLVASMNTEADLNEMGEIMQRVRFVALLSSRLRVRKPTGSTRRSTPKRSRALSS